MRLFLFSLLVFASSILFAQKVTISGYVEDAASGEKMIGANVYDGNSLTGTITNTYGFFSLTLDSGDIELTVSFIGYNTYKRNVELRTDMFQNITLNQNIEIEEIIVTAKSIHKETQMSAVLIPMKQIEKLPALMGEKDILKTVQLTPGIQSGSEGSSGLYVRGGSPDQNLILLDGVPVYNASHLFGFFSVFNSNSIKSVEIIKGGFPARYGGRTSSVLDIRMKEGNNKKFSGEGSIGLISSKLTLEGPIVKDKTSFIVSGRRTYIDVLAKPLLKNRGDGSVPSYFFYDVNAKLNHKFSDKSRIFLSTYFGRDKAITEFNNSFTTDSITTDSEFENNIEWGNNTTTLRFNHIINKKLFVNATGIYSKYQFNTGFKGVETSTTLQDSVSTFEFGYDYFSSIQDWGGKVEFDYLPNPNHFIRFGFSDIYHTFKPGVNAFDASSDDNNIDTTFGAKNIFAHELSLYIEDDIKLGERIKINPGLHYSVLLVNDTIYNHLQPRFSLNYLLGDNFSVKASYARMAQYLHLLTNGTIGLPTDLWVPVTDSVPPIKANQYAAGIAYTFDNKYEISVEGYYKNMLNLIEYKDGASFFSRSENWDKKIEMGEGDSYGAEVFIQRKEGQTSGWIGYTLSWTNRQFSNLNFGKKYPFKYDRRHDISIAIVHEMRKRSKGKGWKTDLGLVWVYGTGNAVSLPVSTYRAYNANGNNFDGSGLVSEIENYTSRNGFREPAYHRMDLSATFTKKTLKLEKSWNISIYNVYNRKNPFFLFFEKKDNNERVLKQLSIFPIIPSFSYNLKF